MGLVMVLRRVTPQEIDGTLKYPKEIHWFLFGEPLRISFFQKLLGKPAPQPHLTHTPPTEETEIDLDKAWHGIYYLLTGKADKGEAPACYLQEGGVEIGKDYHDYVGAGPARTLSAQQTQAFHQHLSSLSEDMLRARYSKEAMKQFKIYPERFFESVEETEALAYLMEHFSNLKAFVAKAAAQQQGLIIYLG